MFKKLLVSTVLLLGTLAIGFAAPCYRCKGKFQGRYFPANSPQLNKVIDFTEKRLKVKLPPSERKHLHSIIYRENRKGDITAKNPKSSAFGLPQGLTRTYKNVNVPYGIKCASCQIEVMIKYVHNRYKSFERASRHWQRKRWY